MISTINSRLSVLGSLDPVTLPLLAKTATVRAKNAHARSQTTLARVCVRVCKCVYALSIDKSHILTLCGHLMAVKISYAPTPPTARARAPPC